MCAVSFAVASDPQPLSDHLQVSMRSVDYFEFLSLSTATRHGMFIFVNYDSVSRSSSFSLFVYAWINREVLQEESFYIMSCQGIKRYVDGGEKLEMPRKASGEIYVWDPAKEKKFLEKLDEYLATTGGKQPTLAILNIWAAQFNTEFEGVPAFGSTLSQNKERMKKIYRGWKVLQSRTGLGYDPSMDRVMCFDDEWQSFIQVYKECKHLRHEGLRNNELYYNVFDKYHAAGASGYGSVTMPDESPSYFDFDASMDNSAYRPVLEEDVTPTTGARNLNNIRSGADVGPSRSRGSSGKRKQRDETDEMTFLAIQEIVTHFRGGSQSGASNEQSSRPDHMLKRSQSNLKINEGSSGSNQEEDADYSDNENSDHDIYIVKVVVAATAKRRNRRIAPQPMHNSRLTGSMRVKEILNGHEDIIQGLIRGNVDVNVDYVFDDGIDDTGPSTGTQQHDSSRGAMNRMRDMIADDM
ncbi:hypothetical protein TIFTF001_001306 [Ficus carica]|uniref:Myb/SANT-like domain-containing protein n=1 Tax=Ficus carica TaxID=3494 RepID=A0AA87Z666_FICCA|nr:hypothetical protein TIFTF001_001306 [Ficus carica]